MTRAQRWLGLVTMSICVIQIFPASANADEKQIKALQQDVTSLRAETKALTTTLRKQKYEIERIRKEASTYKKEASTNRSRTKQIERYIDSLSRKTTNIEKQQAINKAELINQLEKQQLAWNRASWLTKLGSIILLIGLMLEILGASLLSGSNLAQPQEDVLTLKPTKPLVDLSTSDVNKEPRLIFLGTLGTFLLVLGFLLQFSGAVVSIDISTYFSVISIAFALCASVIVPFYLLGQTSEQTRIKKIRTLWMNVRRNFIQPLTSIRFSKKKIIDTNIVTKK